MYTSNRTQPCWKSKWNFAGRSGLGSEWFSLLADARFRWQYSTISILWVRGGGGMLYWLTDKPISPQNNTSNVWGVVVENLWGIFGFGSDFSKLRSFSERWNCPEVDRFWLQFFGSISAFNLKAWWIFFSNAEKCLKLAQQTKFNQISTGWLFDQTPGSTVGWG